MGKANMIGLQHISLTNLGQLFDSFTARKSLSLEECQSFSESMDDDDCENALSHRQMHNFISQVLRDNEQNKEAIAWANNVVQTDIRTSSVGIIPLLYMDIHPHYGQNYDYCDYLVDLDKKVFVFSESGIEIPLELIQKTPTLNIEYFFDNDFSLLDSDKYSEFFEDGIEDYMQNLDDDEKSNALKKAQELIIDIFSIPTDNIQKFYDLKEKEREEWLLKNTPPQKITDNSSTECSSVLYTTEIIPSQLCKFIYFLQEKAKQPGYEFLLNCVDWELDENYSQTFLRLKSPSSSTEDTKFKEIMFVLENTFKQNFNIFSGDFSIFNSEKELTLQSSLYSFEELHRMLSPEDFSLIMNEGSPYLSYFSYLNEAIPHIILQPEKNTSPIFWTFIALLSQNADLFKVIYPFAQQQLSTLTQENKTKVENNYISSFYDGEQLSQLLGKCSDFKNYITTTTLFQDCFAVLNQVEKEEFLK